MDDAGTDRHAKTRKAKRVRSTSFPFNSLPECVGYVKEFAKYGNKIEVSALATILGHQSPKSGSFLQKLSSLRNWHLLDGRGETLTVTELSKQLANPINDNQYNTALKEAFSHSKAFRSLLDGLDRGSDFRLETIGNLAVQKYGVSHKARGDFVSSLVASAKAAGAITDVTDDSFTLGTDDHMASADKPTEGQINMQRERESESDNSSSPPQREQFGVLPSVVGDTWPIQGGEISFAIRSNRPLSASVYAGVAHVVEGIEELARSLGWNKETASGDPGLEESNGTPC